MHKPNTVRLAGTEDIESLYWHLLNDYEADNGLGWTPSPKKVLAHVRECCLQENGVAGIIDGLNGVIGSIGIEVYTPWYSDDEYLAQVWLFVMPEYRFGKRHWDDLCDFADWYREQMSEKLGKPLVLESSVTSHNRLPAKVRLWRRRAGHQVGATFWSGAEVAPSEQP